MRIGIDISPVVYETGVSLYTKNLIRALLDLDKEDDFVLFGGSLRRIGELRMAFSNQQLKTFPIPPTLLDIFWNRLHALPIEWLIGKVDVFHSSDWAQPPTKAFKVTTIHDLVPIRFPEISHPKIVSTHRARLKWVKKEVNRVIAVSEATKKEIVHLLDIDPGKIVVIPEAPDPGLKISNKEEVTRTKKKFGIPENYLLVVGADPRKNIPAVIQAFGRIRKRTAGMGLVIAGRHWDKIPTGEGIKFLGHVTRSDLATLYSGALALVYTSLYEGFGLPILEAMKLGCPVVTSNISSMPEVAGDAAVLVDPANPDEIAEGIEKVLSNRNHWIRLGRGHVKKFSWEKTARKTLDIYRQAKH